MTSIKTDRLLLRRFEEEDWRAVHEYASDPEVVRFMVWGPNTEEETRNFIRQNVNYYQEHPQKNHTFAVVQKTEDRPIGSCGIHVSNFKDQEGEIGYCFPTLRVSV
jgi:RimJ/RimL family protein N-acetyltransferase